MDFGKIIFSAAIIAINFGNVYASKFTYCPEYIMEF